MSHELPLHKHRPLILGTSGHNANHDAAAGHLKLFTGTVPPVNDVAPRHRRHSSSVLLGCTTNTNDFIQIYQSTNETARWTKPKRASRRCTTKKGTKGSFPRSNFTLNNIPFIYDVTDDAPPWENFTFKCNPLLLTDDEQQDKIKQVKKIKRQRERRIDDNGLSDSSSSSSSISAISLCTLLLNYQEKRQRMTRRNKSEKNVYRDDDRKETAAAVRHHRLSTSTRINNNNVLQQVEIGKQMKY